MKTVMLTAVLPCPVYDREIKLVVCTDQVAAKAYHLLFGGKPFDGWLEAECMAKDAQVVLLYRKDCLAHNVLAHEIFHCTYHILHDIGDTFDPDHAEPYCYLCGWITQWVYEQLKKAKLRIR